MSMAVLIKWGGDAVGYCSVSRYRRCGRLRLPLHGGLVSVDLVEAMRKQRLPDDTTDHIGRVILDWVGAPVQVHVSVIGQVAPVQVHVSVTGQVAPVQVHVSVTGQLAPVQVHVSVTG